MNIDQKRINDLVAHPSESLNVEIKRWLDLKTPEDIAKIVKATLAIRNRNGGLFLIGFDDESLLPDFDNKRSDVRAAFHLDTVQGLISRYASEPFEIGVSFGLRDDVEFPVIVVPEGVTVPVTAKRDLKDSAGTCLIREGDIYFRTLQSNGTPSMAKVRSGDWRDIMEICFENKEADIGRFLRRHLAGQNIEKFVAALSDLHGAAVPLPPSLRDRAEALLQDGKQRAQAAIAARDLKPDEAAALKGLAWSVALVIDPAKPAAVPDRNFLNTVAGANPQYTGWPVWLDSSRFQDQDALPKVYRNGVASLHRFI